MSEKILHLLISKIIHLGCFFILNLFFVIFIIQVPQVSAQQPKCCPVGFSNNQNDCPLFTDLLSKCCKRHGFMSYEVVDNFICGTTPPPAANMCCPSGFGTGDGDCPLGVDRTTQCCRRNGLFNYEVVSKITCGTTPPPAANMCCPSGFGTGDGDCPLGVDRTTQCCKRDGFGSYTTINKIQCGTSVTGNYCCPATYGGECPFGTDKNTKCCKRLGFAQYEVVDKIQCTLSAVPQGGNLFQVQTCTSITGEAGISTGIGCIPITSGGVVQFFFRIALGIGGGLAFLLIILGGGKIMISRSDPKALNEGREIFSSAIIGLIVIILSVVFLGIIGVDVLGLPGFSR